MQPLRATRQHNYRVYNMEEMLKQILSKLEAHDARFDAIDQRLDMLDRKVDAVDDHNRDGLRTLNMKIDMAQQLLNGLNEQQDQLVTELVRHSEEMRRLDTRISKVEQHVGRIENKLLN